MALHTFMIYVCKNMKPMIESFSSFLDSESKKDVSKNNPKATLLWKPFDDLTQEDESIIDGYLELACSPAILHGGRNKEIALHFLQSLGGSMKVKWLSTYLLWLVIVLSVCNFCVHQLF